MRKAVARGMQRRAVTGDPGEETSHSAAFHSAILQKPTPHGYEHAFLQAFSRCGTAFLDPVRVGPDARRVPAVRQRHPFHRRHPPADHRLWRHPGSAHPLGALIPFPSPDPGMTLETTLIDWEEYEADREHTFYAWPRPAALDFEPLYEELRKRQPRAANVNIGVALLRAEQRVRPDQGPDALLDEAEACLTDCCMR